MAYRSSNMIAGHEARCPVCRKKYWKGNEWAYKSGYTNRERFFCSWKCLRAWEKDHPEKKIRLKEE